jgi:hypothetical protein
MGLAFARRQSRARKIHRIRDGVVDLILNRAVGRPTAGHSDAPHLRFDRINGAFKRKFQMPFRISPCFNCTLMPGITL